MARPVKWRNIEATPAVPFFVPQKTIEEGTEVNNLLLEELEAIRLKDLEGLEQAECAARMEVSRPTFQRILISAREKIADSLIRGTALHIDGGSYTRNVCKVTCENCHTEWKESFENLEKIKTGEFSCPNCGSKVIHCQNKCKGRFCNHHCWREK